MKTKTKNIYNLALSVYAKLKPLELIDYQETAKKSLNEHINEKLTDLLIKDFIINTLIINEILNGFRDIQTGELIY